MTTSISLTEPQEETHFGPWTDLPSDHLKIISAKLTDVVDYFNFRAVCSPWRSSSSPSKSPMLPLLLLPRHPHSDVLSFFHLPSCTITTSHFPQTRNKVIIGSDFGWLALVSQTEESVSLFNPFTRSQINLPPTPFVKATSSRYVEGADATNSDVNSPSIKNPDESDSRLPYGYMQSLHPWRISLDKNPSETDDYIVSATFSCVTKFAIYKPAQSQSQDWVLLGSRLFNEIVFSHDCKLYLLDNDGSTDCVDMASNRPLRILTPKHGFDSVRTVRYHVVYVDGKLHMVVYVMSDEIYDEAEEGLKVFKLEERGGGEEGGKPEWCEVGSVGEFAIFLSGTHASAFRAAEIPGCKEDCIYFSGIYATRIESRDPGVHFMDVYDMKEKKFELMSFPWVTSTKGWQSDTWITPCPR